MVTLLALWERGWFDLKVESFMWRQLANAYDVEHRLCEAILDFGGLQGERVFLDPFKGESLDEFEHPEDVVYVFGKAEDNNHRHIQHTDGVVRICTPKPCDLFAIQAAAIVLDDRRRKYGHR